MSLRIRVYAIRTVGFLYGIIGYGLSVFTCVVGATLGPLFFDFIGLAALKPSTGSNAALSVQRLDPRHGRRPKKWSSRPSETFQRHDFDSLAATHGKLVPNDVQLQCAASLDSLRVENSLGLVAPVITINHVDRIDNMSIKAPTITLYPRADGDFGKKQNSKRRSATISHQALPPHPLSSKDSLVGAVSGVSNLEPSGNDKSRIYRSASSPQLFSMKQKQKIPFFGSPGKGGRKVTRQEKTADPITYQPPPSKLFSTFPNVAKKRSQTLRTQPYDEHYCIPLTVPPICPKHLKSAKKVKRSRTLLPENTEHPSLQPRSQARP